SNIAIIGIDLSTKDTRLVFFHDNNISSGNYNTTRMLRECGAQLIPNAMFDSESDELLNSGIIDIEEGRALIEIGDEPWLLDRQLGEGKTGYVTTQLGCPKYTSAANVSKRVATIQEAHELTKQPDGQVMIVEQWWATPMEPGFEPPRLDAEHIKTLSTPLTPLDYGFTIDQCYVIASRINSDISLYSLVPKREYLSNVTAKNTISYQKAKTAWVAAKEAYDHMFLSAYKGLSVMDSRYSRGPLHDGDSGAIVQTGTGVYIRGEIKNMTIWENKTSNLPWHRLNNLCNRIVLR
ncbi:hypothetical protein LCGC14_2850230, partial [marine sediment metagenome]